MSRLLISSLRFHTIHIFIDAHVSRSYLVTHLLQLCLESLQSKELIKALKKWPSQKRQTLPSAFSVATLVKRESTLLEINISHPKALLKMIFLFPRWDMLVYWRVPHSFPHFSYQPNSFTTAPHALDQPSPSARTISQLQPSTNAAGGRRWSM